MADAAVALKPAVRKLSKHLRKLEAKIEDYDANIAITSSEEERGMWDSSDGEGTANAVNNGASGSGTQPKASSGPSTEEIVAKAVAAALKAQNESAQYQQRKQEWTVNSTGSLLLIFIEL